MKGEPEAGDGNTAGGNTKDNRVYFVPGIGTVSQATHRRTVMTSSLKLEPFSLRELRFLLLGAAAEVVPDLSAMDPLEVELRTATGDKCVGWLGTRGWGDICALSDMLEESSPQGKRSEVNMKSLIASFSNSSSEWKEVFDAEDPDFTPFPDGWDKDKSKDEPAGLDKNMTKDKLAGRSGNEIEDEPAWKDREEIEDEPEGQKEDLNKDEPEGLDKNKNEDKDTRSKKEEKEEKQDKDMG